MPHKPIAIVAILTIYHNFQYHRLIWFHNKKYANKLSSASERSSNSTVREGVSTNFGMQPSDERSASRERYGPAALISRRLLYYIAFGIFFGLLYQGPRQFLGYLSLKSGSGLVTEQSFATQLAISFLWGYAFIP